MRKNNINTNENNSEIMLTIFTPTYNRAYLLPKLYESLTKQTNKDFIWMIVDDGSNDNTKELTELWKSESKIEIDYHYKQNGGKNTAIDLAHSICKTYLIACVDSDDFLTEDSVEVIYKHIDKIKDGDIVGMVSRCAHSDKKPFSENWPKQPEILYFNKLSKEYKYNLDTYLIFKTDIIKNFKFPCFDGENFVTESVLYNQFFYDYQMLTLNELIYIAEYMPDGYTNMGMKLFNKNPNGYLYLLKQYTYIACKINIESLKMKLYLITKYYVWKRVYNLNDPCAGKYEVNFFYKALGKVLSIIFFKKFKKEIDV